MAKQETTNESVLANKGQRHNLRKRVVKLRTKELLSWAEIGNQLGVAPRTVRRLFQEQVGAHQHHDHLPNKGGRFPTTAVPADTKAVVLTGDGTVNTWVPLAPAEETTDA